MADVSKIGANGIEYDVCDTAARLGVQTANSNISSLRDDMTNDESDIADLQSAMTTAQGDITTLQGDVDDLQAADTDLQDQINALKNTSASGYCKMPDGTLMQWGVLSVFAQSGDVISGTVQLNSALPFVNTAYTVILTPQRNCIAYLTSPIAESNSGGNVTRTTTSFAIVAKGTNANISVSWLAVGRWK